jgi:hypothetical protein
LQCSLRLRVERSGREFRVKPGSTLPKLKRFADLLASDVVFHSPVFVHPVTGRDFVAKLLETAHTIFGVPTYRLRLSEGSDTMLLFDGEVDVSTLQVAVVIRDGPLGLI